MNYIKPQIVETADGSHSLYLEALDETYHSHHGALQESQHVYIRSGLDYLKDQGQKNLKVFEFGFGTGLNVFLTAAYAEKTQTNIYLQSIEKYPVAPEALHQMNYKDMEQLQPYAAGIAKIVDAEWEIDVVVSPHFTIRKTAADFMVFEPSQNEFDIIYFDAFGFRAQSEMWSEAAFIKCLNLVKKGGILVTYASQGTARRNMEKVGFSVDRIAGAPGKREMMRATKV